MTVWIVLENYGHEGDVFRGVFSRYDRAVAFAKEQAKTKHNSENWEVFYDVWKDHLDAPCP